MGEELAGIQLKNRSKNSAPAIPARMSATPIRMLPKISAFRISSSADTTSTAADIDAKTTAIANNNSDICNGTLLP